MIGFITPNYTLSIIFSSTHAGYMYRWKIVDVFTGKDSISYDGNRFSLAIL